MVVFRKILSTLVRFFIKFSSEWPFCIPSVISTLAGNRSRTGGDGDLAFQIQNLDERRLILSLDFCQLLLDETQSGKLSSVEESQVNEQLKNNIPALSLLLCFCSRSSFGSNILENVFKTYSLYGTYPIMEMIKTTENLLPVTAFIFSLLEKGGNDELIRNALDEITTILERNPGFYSSDMKTHLARILIDMGRPLIEAIISKNQEIESNSSTYIYADDDDMDEMEGFTKVFARITIALCEAELRHTERAHSDTTTVLFQYLLVISNFPGIPYVDHNITMDVLEFWNTYADSLEEESNNGDSNPLLLQVIEIFWKKSAFPIFKSSWDHDMNEAFDSFRRDFWDFLELSYNLVGGTLFSTLTNNIVENFLMDNIDWLKIEASLSCISALTDSVPVANEYELLSQLLSSGLLPKVDSANDANVKMTAIGFVGSYDNFFEMDAGKPFLFDALNFLFKSLVTSSLANSTSKSILKLCSSNRAFLSDNFQEFFNTYVSMRLYQQLDNLPHQRTVLAISSVAQSLKDVEAQATYIGQLLGVITQEIERESHLYDTSFEEQSLFRIVSLLKCIASIGKGLQEPDDAPQSETDTQFQHASFWQADKHNIKPRIIKVIEIISLQPKFNSRVDINEACCDILKTGFLEHASGPFVFSLDTIVQFIKTKCCFDESFSVIAEFTNCFVTSYALKHSENLAIYIHSIIDIFSSFASSPLKDGPEAQTAYLKLHRQIILSFLTPFLQHHLAFDIIQYATFTISSQERFVLRESAKLWTALLKASNEHLESHIAALGPSLVNILVQKISGESMRSELEYYVDVIKPLMQKHSIQAKVWLNKALIDESSTLVGRIPVAQRRLILQQLVNLRGNKQTASVVREFWLNSKGITDYT